MNKSRNTIYKILSGLLITAFTVFTFIIQDVFVPAAGFKMPVYLLVPLTVAVSIQLNDIPALFYGIFTGALFDLISGAPDGIYTLVFAIIAFISSALTKKTFRNSRNVSFLFSLIGCILICLISFTVNFCFGDISSPSLIIKGFYIPALIATVIISPVFYPVIYAINRIKNEEF